MIPGTWYSGMIYKRSCKLQEPGHWYVLIDGLLVRGVGGLLVRGEL